MAWIESHTVIARHWKTVALAKSIRRDIPTTAGHLHLLWHTILEQQEDGDLSLWDDDRIADSAMYKGDAKQFVLSLTTARWLDPDRKAHDWLDYVGLYLIRKYSRRNKAKLAEIWQRYGRVYGSQEAASDGRATGERQSFTERVGRSPENSSLMEEPEKPPDKDGEEDSAWLARLWLLHRRGAHTEHDRKSADNFADLLAAGVAKEVIEKEIKNRERSKANEPIWTFCKRLTPTKNTKDRFAGTKAFLENETGP